ncbi:MAG: hypothetical protein ACYTGL_24145 [Planctomycetota bacterium]
MRHPRRRGFLAPAALIALVVVVMATALTVDRLWIDNAHTELTTAAEAAALGGARTLVTDDRLRNDFDPDSLVTDARRAAISIARENLVAGEAVVLDPSADGDVRIGRLISRDDHTVFLETNHAPTSVVVHAEHSRHRNNPVARFFDGWQSEQGADVASRAEATVDNRVVGFRPLNGVPVPVLPIAILRASRDASDVPNWERDIEQRLGSDNFSIDPETGEVLPEPDGIPEIVLRNAGTRKHTVEQSRGDETKGQESGQAGTSQDQTNVYAFVLNPRATMTDVEEQFRNGWREADYPEGLDILRFDRGPVAFTTLNSISGRIADALHAVTGQPRILFLFDDVTHGNDADQVSCVAAVAGRVMSIDPSASAGCEIILQPTILTTRTAVLCQETVTQGPSERFANQYTYKLQLTH